MKLAIFAVTAALLTGCRVAAGEEPEKSGLRAGRMKPASLAKTLDLHDPDHVEEAKADVSGGVHPAGNLNFHGHGRNLADGFPIKFTGDSRGSWSTFRGSENSGDFYLCGLGFRWDPVWLIVGLKTLYCSNDVWDAGSDWQVEYDKGHHETQWVEKKCDQGYFINGGKPQIDPVLNKNLLGFKISCANKAGASVFKTVRQQDGFDRDSWLGPNTYTGRFAAAMRFKQDITVFDISFDMVEPPSEALSNNPVIGSWESKSSGSPFNIFELTESFSRTDGRSVTNTFGESVGAAIEQKLKAGALGTGTETTVSVSAEISHSLAKSVENTLEKSVSQTFSATCQGVEGTNKKKKKLHTQGADGSYAVLWQYVITQDPDAEGLGFDLESTFFACTPGHMIKPRCVPVLCLDLGCQLCDGDETTTDSGGDSSGKVYEHRSGIGGLDVSSSPDGTVWAISSTPDAGTNNLIYRWTGAWTSVAGSAKRVSVGNSDNILVTTAQGKLFKWSKSSGGWGHISVPEPARDASIAADGIIWMTAIGSGAHGKIYRRAVSGVWETIAGLGDRIGAGSAEKAALCNGQGSVYIYRDAGWKHGGDCKPGSSIDVDSDGTIWKINAGGAPVMSPDYGATWNAPITGQTGTSIGGSNKDGFFLVTDSSEIWQYHDPTP